MKKTISLVLVLVLGMATEVAKADFVFGTPTAFPYFATAPSISTDGLSLYADYGGGVGGYGGYDIWIYTRETINDDWSGPVNLTAINSAYNDINVSVTADGLSLFFMSDRPGWHGKWDIWVSTRETEKDDWGTSVNLGPPVNSAYREFTSCISADGLELYIGSDRTGGSGGHDLWVARRATKEDDWEEPVNLRLIVNSPSDEFFPNISADGLRLFFVSLRSGGYGGRDIWVTTRATKDSPWSEPVNLRPSINTSAHEQMVIISPKDSVLYFNSSRYGVYGSFDIWQMSIAPSSEVF